MPTIFVKIPKNVFPRSSRALLTRNITEAAAAAEQVGPDARQRFLCWVSIDEVEPGNLACGGSDATAQLLPCIAWVCVPEGVLLDQASRQVYVQRMHAAFQQSLPEDERRPVMTSILLHDVAEGTWGGNGMLWTLPDLARAAGFAHLQHLVKPTAGAA